MEAQLFTVTMLGSTIVINDARQHGGLRMVLILRGDAKDLGDDWMCPGVYLLLEDGPNGGWRSYVGKATNLRARVLQDHRLEGFEWNRELLVRSPERFDTADIGWLEGRIYGLLKEAGVLLANKQRPKDDTLDEFKKTPLKIHIGVIQSALTLLGYPVGGEVQATERDTGTEQEERGVTTTRSRRNVLDVVSVGQRIKSTSPKHRGATATIDANGGVRYKGRLYATPSAAAKAVTKTNTANGWSFWGIGTESGLVKLRDLRDRDPSPDLKRGSRTTPAKMSRATRERFFARHDEGATYAELRKEFGLTQGSVYKLLKESGRVKGRS